MTWLGQSEACMRATVEGGEEAVGGRGGISSGQCAGVSGLSVFWMEL